MVLLVGVYFFLCLVFICWDLHVLCMQYLFSHMLKVVHLENLHAIVSSEWGVLRNAQC